MTIAIQCRPDDLSANILRDLHRLWNSRRSTRRCPSRTDLNPFDMRFTFPSTAVIEVIGEPPRFRFRYANINWVIGGAPKNLAGRYADEIVMAGFAEQILPIWQQVVKTGAPVGILRNDSPIEVIPAQEALVLPFAADYVNVDRLMMVLDPQGRMIDPFEDRKSMPRFAQPKSPFEIPQVPLRKIFEWWLAARDDSGFPPVNFTLDPRLLPFGEYLLDIIFDPVAFEFRYDRVGDAINRIHGISLSGRRFDDILPAHVLVEIVAVYDHCLESRMPVLGRGHRRIDGVERGFDILILPLSSNGRVERFLNCQIYDEEAEPAFKQDA